ncbi:hypothetical protein HDU85_002652 [Gaertneriomyces sp. JEL0708]|nr:hypothetical protein HDU85_002652 [Gaertneriomyces sp. JEL0708]
MPSMSPVCLPTPPSTPLIIRKSAGCPRSRSRSVRRKTVTKHHQLRYIPNEIWSLVISFISTPADLFPLLTVSKSWHAIALKKLYEYIEFTSLKQRNAFVETVIGGGTSFEEKRMPGMRPLVMPPRESANFIADGSDLEPLSSPMALAAEPAYPMPMTPVFAVCPEAHPSLLIKGIDFGFRDAQPPEPSFTPAPTPASSVATTPSSSAPASPLLIAAQSPIFSSLLDGHDHPLAYGQWSHTHVSHLLMDIASRCPNLTYLGLSRCQIVPWAFSDALPLLPHLTHLDVSFSNVRGDGLLAIADNLHSLQWLDISGILRLKRVRAKASMPLIVKSCPKLMHLVAHQCPDFYDSVRQECLEINPRLQLSWSNLWTTLSAWKEVVIE